MNKALLHKEVQQFISTCEASSSEVAFKGSSFPEISTQALLQQLEGYRKAEKKLPSWHQNPNIIYPPKLNLEQCSSEITASYKASLAEGRSMADLTGGFGVDALYFSRNFEEVTYFEWNEPLFDIVQHNFSALGIHNVLCILGNGLDFLNDRQYDLIYIDPARRHETKGKVFFLRDCEPNVVEHLGMLFEHSKKVMIKTSPMLDISVGLNELEGVSEIHVVAVNNEVKELLWILDPIASTELKICTVNFRKNDIEKFDFIRNKASKVEYAAPTSYIYEPNAAILKAGAFQELCSSFPVKKLAEHSHLYTSDEVVPFPGRAFHLKEVIPYHKGAMKTLLHSKANITTRNFSASVAELRKKWKIKEGGDTYLFFTTLHEGDKVVLVLEKMDS